jgi:hypothetical protein
MVRSFKGEEGEFGVKSFFACQMSCSFACLKLAQKIQSNLQAVCYN